MALASNDLVSKKLYSIKIVKQSPAFVFPEEWFPVTIVIEKFATKSETVQGASDVVGIVSKLTAFPDRNEISNDTFCGGVSLVTNPEKICLNFEESRENSETLNIMCKIKSRVFEDKVTKYSISFFQSQTKPSFRTNLIPLAQTTTTQLVSMKLAIDDKTWPDIWFKDEGGKDKSMEAKVSLIDACGEVIKDKRIPLNVTLLYDDKQSSKVMKQETLRILSPSQQFIDPKTGECSIHFRIKEVSKNHQGQSFKLEIAPNALKEYHIAKVCTPSVCVRSKRNKRIRPTTPRKDTNENRTTISPTRPLSLTPSKREINNVSTLDGSLNHADIPNNKRLRKAMKTVVNWAEEIVNTLSQLKWSIVGYENFPDGSINYNRPYHSMPNPNDHIKRILSMYSEKTRSDLQIVRNTIENTMESIPDGLKLMKLPQTECTEPFRFRNHIHTSMGINHGKKYTEGNIMQLYDVPQMPSYPSLSGNHHIQQSTNLSNFSPHMIEQQALNSSRHFQQKYLDERMSFQDPKMSPLNPEMQARRFSPNHESDILMINRSHGESELERIQDDKVDEEIDTETIQKDIEFILAKQFKCKRNRQKLGFPAFNSKKVVVGFYTESKTKVGVGRFILLSKYKDNFGPDQMVQATILLRDAIKENSEAVYSIHNYGSLQNMIGHALAYEWSKDQ